MQINKDKKLWEVTYDGGSKRIRTRYQDLYGDFEQAISGEGYIVSIEEFDIVPKRKIPKHEMERVLFAHGKGM